MLDRYICTLTCLIAASIPSVTSAASSPLLHPLTKTEVIPAYAQAGTGRIGLLDAKSLAGASITLMLPDGRIVTAHQSHVERMDATGSITWSGDVQTGGQLLITRHRGTVTGVLHYGGVDYELRPGSDGQHVMYAVDVERLPRLEPEQTRSTPKASADAHKGSVLGHLTADQVPVVHDVFILYTANSLATYGKALLESNIVNAVASANGVYRRSNVGITLQLVGMQLSSSVPESPAGMTATLADLRASGEANQVRDASGADMVLLVNQGRDWCGYAYILGSTASDFSSLAFGAVSTTCLSQDVIAHEVGHIQGLMHDRTSEPAHAAYPYGHGYRDCAAGFRTIMAYECPGLRTTRIRQFSNPALYYNDQPTGIAHATAPSTSADATRALNQTAAIVAGYRGGGSVSVAPVTPAVPQAIPQGPTDLRASVLSSTQIDLAWRDNSTNEAGFKVFRNAGPDQVEIAQVGAGMTNYSDATVSEGATYSYRVTAYNSVGFSTDSATALAEIDGSPNAVTFTSQRGVTMAATVTSNLVTISGINVPVPTTVRNGSYSIGCTGTFTSGPGSVTSGQSVCVRHTSATEASASVVTTLEVGTASIEFVSTTAAAPVPARSSGGVGGGAGSGGGGGAFDLLGLLGVVAARRLRRWLRTTDLTLRR